MLMQATPAAFMRQLSNEKPAIWVWVLGMMAPGLMVKRRHCTPNGNMPLAAEQMNVAGRPTDFQVACSSTGYLKHIKQKAT